MSYLTKRLRMSAGRQPYHQVVLADRPYAYWRLDEISGTVAADLGGNDFDGIYTGEVQLAGSALLPSTKLGYLVLSALGSHVDVSAARNFCAGGSWSIECWANVASYNNLGVGGFPTNKGCRFLGNVLYTFQAGWQKGLEWGIHSIDGISPDTYRYYDGDYAYAPGFKPPPVGTLQYVVLTRTAEAFTVYLNGAPIQPTARSIAAPAIHATLHIGSAGGSMGRMNGAIGEFALYDRALSHGQVAAHYEAGIA